MFLHANGDAAIDDALYAFRKAQEAFPREDTRHTLIHAQMAREDQLDEMAELGLIPSFSSFILITGVTVTETFLWDQNVPFV